MCNIQALITNGIVRLGDDAHISEEFLTPQYVICNVVVYNFRLR